MTKKIFAMLLLSLAVSACDSNPADTNSNATNANANAPAQASPTTASSPAQASPTVSPSPSAEQAAATAAQLKAGDKVKIMVNGLATEATVVGVDEKLSKVTVKVPGESKERTVAIADITRQ